MGINSGKTTGESMEIGSELFVAMMKGHNLSASNMFDKENNLKKPIRKEALERLGFCEKEIDKSVKNLYQKKMGKIPDNDLMKKLSKGFVWWFLDEFELTKKQLKIIQNWYMNKFLILLSFLSLPFAIEAGFPEGKDGFNIKKMRIIIGCHLKR